MLRLARSLRSVYQSLGSCLPPLVLGDLRMPPARRIAIFSRVHSHTSRVTDFAIRIHSPVDPDAITLEGIRLCFDALAEAFVASEHGLVCKHQRDHHFSRHGLHRLPPIPNSFCL